MADTIYTFSSMWANSSGTYLDTGVGTVSITVPDGEIINSGDPVTVTTTVGSLNFTYIGMLEDGSPGLAISGSSVTHQLTNGVRSSGSPFPPDSDFDTSVPLCFLPGTLIATPAGARPVEELAIGDLVLTAKGGVVPVKWIGQQTVHTIFGMAEGRRPVCISAGALGNNLPARDLKLTSDHALLIDGVLVHAGALVNGTTIRRMAFEELGQRFTVYHIETENHEVVLAEGTPTETFIDNVSRARFDNYAEYEALYGPAPAPMAELSQPRAMSRRQVPASIHARIAAAAAQVLPQGEQAA
jgi:Hint domain